MKVRQIPIFGDQVVVILLCIHARESDSTTIIMSNINSVAGILFS